MVSVQVGSRRDTVSITGPHGACVIIRGQTERIRVFSQAIDVWVLREVGLHANVLWLKDEGVRGRGKKNFFGLSSVDGEGEWRGCVVEFD